MEETPIDMEGRWNYVFRKAVADNRQRVVFQFGVA
jgi:hypothetical protein